jgi:transaldolase/glucose-6-phosphate isomerase
MSLIARERLGPIASAVDAADQDLEDRKAVGRMWAADHTLWQDDPTEVADRLGWLHLVDTMRNVDLSITVNGRIALCGMGGSSLFPEVLARTFPSDVELVVLDTTDPAAIGRVPIDGTTFIVASKSGTTIETTSQLDHFWAATSGDADRFVVITDPGTPLGDLGRQRGFQRVVGNPPDIGGRYSALSCFGLVPATALGVDVHAELLDPARAVDPTEARRLAAILGAATKAGRDKLTLLFSDELASFGLWVEQLVAESTGKHGTGIVPVVGEPLGEPDVYGDDRVFVVIGDVPGIDALAEAGHPVIELEGKLGGLVMLWEQAVALCGVILGINPFDQPDVQSAKRETTQVLEEGLPAIKPVRLAGLLDAVKPGDYLAILAFVDPGDAALLADIERARRALRDQLRVATTVGIGPRYLHSTGQLHKGGPRTGVFLQLLGDDPHDVGIPNATYDFSELKQAQAAGDLRALQSRGLRAGRITIEALLEVASS